MKEIKPIFVMGAPRSGTTLLGSVIGSHPKAITLPEMQYIFPLIKKEVESGPIDNDSVADTLRNSFHFCQLGLLNNYSELRSFVNQKSVKELIYTILKEYNKKYDPKNYDYWVEHFPYSNKYLPYIIKLFPDAQFVHIIRDPRAAVASLIKTEWGVKDVITASSAWQRNVSQILNDSELYNILTIQYETFVVEPEKTTQMVCDHIGMSYSSDMLKNTGLIFPEHRVKEVLFVSGSAIDNKRNEKWKNELSNIEIKHINFVCQEIMAQFGYIENGDKFKLISGLRKRFMLRKGHRKSQKLREQFLAKRKEIDCKRFQL